MVNKSHVAHWSAHLLSLLAHPGGQGFESLRGVQTNFLTQPILEKSGVPRGAL
jgi:hypothetical protein